MLATLVDKAPSGKGWSYEIKWDGYRAVSLCDQKSVDIISRNNKSFNEKFYPIKDALEKLALKAVLDGEIVVLNEHGSASFNALQNWRSEADGEIKYYVFDLLWLNGRSLMELPLNQRQDLLKSLLPKEGIIRANNSFDETPIDELLSAARQMNLEGLIAKRNDSMYLPGERVLDWLKIKIQKRIEVVIGGYTKNEGSSKTFSSLLVGVYENDHLQYIGKIGTGFNDKQQKEMIARFKPLIRQTNPFSILPDVNKPSRFRPNPPHAEVTWLKPELVCEVSFTELTVDGIMRHPSFEGMREDKNAKDVHPEPIVKLEKEIFQKLDLQPVKAGDRKTLLNPSEETQVKKIKGHDLTFNHLSKVFWPDEGYTKRDLLNYYYQAASFILPYLKGRPQSLNRFPNGIEGLSFYQKDVTKSAPEWIKLFPYHTSDDKDKNFLVVQDEADLLWMANLGAIEMNPWNSTIEQPDYPDWCIIDIDPSEKNAFDLVIETALATKDVLDELKIEGYCKTSGATGMHIYIPMGAKYTYDQCQLFGRLIATSVHRALPEFTSIERYTDKRKDKIYVDFLQNRPKATLAAPYSVRPKPGATVSMPLHWDEVIKGLLPQQFTLTNAIQRMRREGDLFKPVLGKGINLEKMLKLLKKDK
ncbi:MAG: DNA ligase D [Candidatus Protochlamydia sp.]|nr:DNA ligase D [Candidatus Protochlamydia sp.]